MKTRLPKMLLAAVLAAMTSAYALPSYVLIDGGHQYYQGGSSGDPTVIDDAANFGSGISSAPASTVNIGYGNDGGVAYDAYFTLSGDEFTTPNALFIGGPGWPHTLTEGYETSKGVLTIDDATLTVGTNIQMGTCAGAVSYLYIQGGSEVYAGHMQVSNGGGVAQATVGTSDSSGYLRLEGNLGIGVNNVTGQEHMGNKMEIGEQGRVDVAGSTSIGYATDEYCGAEGMLFIQPGGTLNTGSLELGIGTMAPGVASKGQVSVAGTLNVTASENETLIGINGGYGELRIVDGGTVNLGSADVRVGATSQFDDTTHAELNVEEGGSLNHDGTIYVGDKGTVSLETGMPNYGVGLLVIEEGATAILNNVEVSAGSKLYVDGNVSVNEKNWGKVDAPGIHLFHDAYVGGAPDGAKLTLVSIREQGDPQADIHMYRDGLTLTKGTTFEACCDTHFKVGSGSTLTFGEGTLWLTDGIGYIDSDGDVAGTITTTGTGHVSVAGNGNLDLYLSQMGSERSGSKDMVALIDVSNFLDNDGTVTGILSESGTLKLDRAGYEVRFTDKAVTVLNDEYDVDDFRGFYVVKVEYPAEEAYPTFDRNQREVYDVIKQLEESGAPIPEELKEVINVVLNMDGRTEAGQIQEALDFLGAVNYSVMMHNQIDANTSHQRMLRNRSMAGRNLRHNKGCTDVYAAGFYDGQRLNGSHSKGEGYRRTEWGGLVGADTCINENLRIGADLAYGRARINPSHNWAMHQDSFYWDVYAQYRKGNWRSITALGMGIHSFDLKRGAGPAVAKANNVKGYSLNFTEEVSYDWKVNEKTTIQPFAALDLNWNTIKAFTDGDLGALNIHVKKQDALAADLTLGGRYIRDFALLTNVPDATWYAQLGVVVSMGKTDCDMDCNFVGTPDSVFTVKAAERDRVGLDLGTGITIPVKDNWAIFANAEAILRGDSHNINAQIGVQVAF
ncbi:MAG: autotransporter outer membrane beta-barrel domain-containing protein [Akkermansia sp.]|nr:autotransporter outer membrane beta-barrel domain-containing protein [Akkermansia sp.]